MWKESYCHAPSSFFPVQPQYSLFKLLSYIININYCFYLLMFSSLPVSSSHEGRSYIRMITANNAKCAGYGRHEYVIFKSSSTPTGSYCAKIIGNKSHFSFWINVLPCEDGNLTFSLLKECLNPSVFKPPDNNLWKIKLKTRNGWL